MRGGTERTKPFLRRFGSSPTVRSEMIPFARVVLAIAMTIHSILAEVLSAQKGKRD